MKSTVNFAITLALATMGSCATDTPGVWLYKDTDEVETYSSRMELDNSCHPDLSDYAGVWIDKDPRSEGYRLGCGYAFQDDDCQGTFNPFELNFSGSEHTTVSFDDVKIGHVGKSFQFSDAPCAGGGVVLHTASSIIEPTP